MGDIKVTPEGVKKEALKAFKEYTLKAFKEYTAELDLGDLIAVSTFFTMLTSAEKTAIIRGALSKKLIK